MLIEQQSLMPPPEAWPVLVVDDEPSMHDQLSMAMEQFHYLQRPLQVDHAHSAIEAWEKISEHPGYAMIFVDVGMETPTSGLELINKIRSLGRLKATQVVLLTGNVALAPPREVIARYEINEYINKSTMNIDRLYTAVHTALAGSYHLQSLEYAMDQIAIGKRDLVRSMAATKTALTTLGLISRGIEDDLRGRLMALQPADQTAVRKLGTELLALVDLSELAGSELNLEVVELSALVSEISSGLGSVLEGVGGQVLQVNLPAIMGDREKLHRLFRQLILHGIALASGALTINFDAQTQGAHLQISMSHNGNELDPAQSRWVFLPPRETLVAAGDMHANLCEARLIAMLHGGDIRLEASTSNANVVQLELPNSALVLG